jgi:hypothetical protein
MTVTSKPYASAHDIDASGRVKFDDRGNAIWETQRGRHLEHPGLSIADEEPPPEGMARPNGHGARVGYNPYQSGMLDKKDERPRKRDLKALSAWIQLKKNLRQND